MACLARSGCASRINRLGSGLRIVGQRRALCSEATPPKATEGFFAWLLREGQIDSGFWQGTGLLALVMGAVHFSSGEQRANAVTGLVRTIRAIGLGESVSDRQLIEDNIQKNSAAAVNVLMASPTFYFLFAKMHGQSIFISCVRAITGTMRIVPFMGFFYAAFGVTVPFLTQALMARGQTYEEAQGNAGVILMLSGFFVIEALVELRGCGVTFAQMTPASFILYLPALIGRLATGVLTQQKKTGSESDPLLPESWREGPTWQQHTAMTFDMLHLDKDFITTAMGTSVFQHVLNGVTWTLLNKGKASTLGDIARFLLGGMSGTALSGAAQFGKTFILRSLFGFSWNWFSSQPVDMPAYEGYLASLPKELDAAKAWQP